MINTKAIGLSLLAALCSVVCGCSSQPDSAASSAMGPAPTAPPANSPYAAAASSGPSPDEFVSKLQSQSRSERAAYMQQNQGVMSSILANPQDSPAKQKLMVIINQH